MDGVGVLADALVLAVDELHGVHEVDAGEGGGGDGGEDGGLLFVEVEGFGFGGLWFGGLGFGGLEEVALEEAFGSMRGGYGEVFLDGGVERGGWRCAAGGGCWIDLCLCVGGGGLSLPEGFGLFFLRGLLPLRELLVQRCNPFHARSGLVGGRPLPEQDAALFLDIVVGERIRSSYAQALEQRLICEGTLEARASVLDEAIEDGQGP